MLTWSRNMFAGTTRMGNGRWVSCSVFYSNFFTNVKFTHFRHFQLKCIAYTGNNMRSRKPRDQSSAKLMDNQLKPVYLSYNQTEGPVQPLVASTNGRPAFRPKSAMKWVFNGLKHWMLLAKWMKLFLVIFNCKNYASFNYLQRPSSSQNQSSPGMNSKTCPHESQQIRLTSYSFINHSSQRISSRASSHLNNYLVFDSSKRCFLVYEGRSSINYE